MLENRGPTVRQQVLKWQKNAQRISSLPRERPHPELRNEPPLDSLEKPVPNPLVASLWIGSGAGWPLKGLGVASPDYQVGAHFEALDEGVPESQDRVPILSLSNS